jgi:hypothetical protein
MTSPCIDPARDVNPALSYERNREAGLAAHAPLIEKAAILQSFRLHMRVSPISGRLIRPAESGNYGRMNNGFFHSFSLIQNTASWFASSGGKERNAGDKQ